MKSKPLAPLLVAAAIFAFGDAQARERIYGGGTVTSGGTTYVLPKFQVNSRRGTVVTVGDQGHCVVRNVTTVNSKGRKVVRRTKHC